MGYLVTRSNDKNVSYSGTQYVNPSTSMGTRRLCIRTNTGIDDIVKYGLTTNSSASNYCGLRMRMDGKTAYIGQCYSSTGTSTTSSTNTTTSKITMNCDVATWTTSEEIWDISTTKKTFTDSSSITRQWTNSLHYNYYESQLGSVSSSNSTQTASSGNMKRYALAYTYHMGGYSFSNIGTTITGGIVESTQKFSILSSTSSITISKSAGYDDIPIRESISTYDAVYTFMTANSNYTYSTTHNVSLSGTYSGTNSFYKSLSTVKNASYCSVSRASYTQSGCISRSIWQYTRTTTSKGNSSIPNGTCSMKSITISDASNFRESMYSTLYGRFYTSSTTSATYENSNVGLISNTVTGTYVITSGTPGADSFTNGVKTYMPNVNAGQVYTNSHRKILTMSSGYVNMTSFYASQTIEFKNHIERRAVTFSTIPASGITVYCGNYTKSYSTSVNRYFTSQSSLQVTSSNLETITNTVTDTKTTSISSNNINL